MIPGEYILKKEDIICNAAREVTTLTAMNTGDRPVQIGSHFHFFEANRQMVFDRAQAFGKRLNIASGTAVRFEPGEQKVIQLIPFGGKKEISGFNGLTNGNTASPEVEKQAISNLSAGNFKSISHEPEHK